MRWQGCSWADVQGDTGEHLARREAGLSRAWGGCCLRGGKQRSLGGDGLIFMGEKYHILTTNKCPARRDCHSSFWCLAGEFILG